MWNLISCYLSGRHDFGVSCQAGNVFLRCVHCGKRSPGWSLQDQPQRRVPMPPPPAHAMSSFREFDTARTARGQ